ncbi:MAG TPA: hypothetical protein VGG34_00055 [Opitutaceae bacterium]
MKRQSGSHKVLERAGWADYVFAFHDGEEAPEPYWPCAADSIEVGRNPIGTSTATVSFNGSIMSAEFMGQR